MHIGIDARLTAYRDGGISTYTRALIGALEQLDTENRYTVLEHRKATASISEKFRSAKLWTPPHNRIERLALSAELLPQRLDVLHSPDFIPPYRGAKRHVITVHDLTFLHYPEYLTADSRRYYNDQIEAACSHADHILVVSKNTKNDLMSMLNVPEEKITIQPHGVDERFKLLPEKQVVEALKKLGLPEKYFLHVGTLEPRKNIIGLLSGYKMLLERKKHAPPILLVGRAGWLFDETQAEIEKLNLDDKLIWRQDITDEQLPIVYNGALALVIASFYEGFGMPALEAMACGTVPIVSNNSSLPEVVGDVGILIDPNNPTTIADALEKILADTHNPDDLIQRAVQFTWERSAKIALEVYTSLG